MFDHLILSLIKEFLAALLRGKKCERSELPFESRAFSGVHTFDYIFQNQKLA
jgi:hypothetical protein